VGTYQQLLNPGDKDIPKFMRQAGARHALDHPMLEPGGVFLVIPGYSVPLPVPGAIVVGAPMLQPKRAITIYGVTTDGRYNLGILAMDIEQDGRIRARVDQVYHWSGRNEDPAHSFTVDASPYLEFFRVNDDVRAKLTQPA
jgi:hypothetical protein